MIERKLKKIIALIMSGALLVTAGGIPQKNTVCAAEDSDYGISSPMVTPKPTIAPDALQLFSDDITAVPGSDVEVPVKIKNNTGIMGLGIQFEFDKDMVTPVDSVEHTNLIAGQFNNSIENALRNKTDNFKILWQGTDEMTQDGLLFKLKFHVASDASGDTQIKLTLLEDDTYDEQYENVSVACNDVRIKIENYIPDIPTATPEQTNTPAPPPTETPAPTQAPPPTEDPKPTIDPDALQLYSDDITAVPGSDVEVPVKIKNNTGIMGLGIQFEFDKDMVTPVDSVEHTNLIAGQFNNSIENALRNKTDNFKILWQGTDEMTQDGLLFKLKFHVASDASGDTQIKLTLLEDDTYDEQYENVSVACNDVRIKIENNFPDIPTATPKPTNTPTTTPDVTQNPDVTQTPDTTQKPDATEQPSATQKPDATEQPSVTQNPDTQNPIIQNPLIQPPQNLNSDNNNFKVAPAETTELTVPAKVKLKSVKASGKKKLIVRWKWVSGQDGFQVQYALNRGFSKGKKNVNVSKDLSEKIIKKLKSKKTYFVRIRAYKTVFGKKVYGKWSNVKKCKVNQSKLKGVNRG